MLGLTVGGVGAMIAAPGQRVDYLTGNGVALRFAGIFEPAAHLDTRLLRGMNTVPPVGDLLRQWRQRRRLSQLDCAVAADISTRHLSFLETGRSLPSREMLLHLADLLEVPLRERNTLLMAAGFAPVFREHALSDPALQAARAAVERVLQGHEPFPALAVDRHWSLLAANSAVPRMLQVADPALLQPPINVLRVSLHPRGLAPHIVNLGAWREHLFIRLRRQIEVSGDATLAALLEELKGYPGPTYSPTEAERLQSSFIVPIQLAVGDSVLSFISTTTVFGTPLDVTLSELAIEAFLPADAETARKVLDGV
jgi:transcriptional regulator with XRE-family HTH domain